MTSLTQVLLESGGPSDSEQVVGKQPQGESFKTTINDAMCRGDWTEERLLSLSLWGPEEAPSLGARIPSCSEPEFSLAWYRMYCYMPEQGTPAKYWLSLQSSHQVTPAGMLWTHLF